MLCYVCYVKVQLSKKPAWLKKSLLSFSLATSLQLSLANKTILVFGVDFEFHACQDIFFCLEDIFVYFSDIILKIQ